MTASQFDKLCLKFRFHFSKMPFTKQMWAKQMYDSQSQRELREGLTLWTDVRGVALVCGPNGSGKSICLRRFLTDLDPKRYESFYLCTVRSTPFGFFRSLCRALNVPVLPYLADMFDAVSNHLADFEQRTGKYPILIIDDADPLSDELLDSLRRLTASEMDREDRFSLILVGSPSLGTRLRNPQNLALHQRIGFPHFLRGFSLLDTKGYIQFHLERADGPKELFSDDALSLIFNVSRGYPRVINQIALQSLIRAAINRARSIS